MEAPMSNIRTVFVSCMVLLGAVAALFGGKLASADEPVMVVPAPLVDDRREAATETAVLAGGCFWGVQGVFQHVKGVSRAVSGYAGGTKETANYDLVSNGRTKHAEAVEITFDPRVISYGAILQIFFSVVHDPTQLNRQGPDTGAHYRSAIFARDPAQRRVAEAYIAQLDKAGIYKKRIATQVNDADPFYAAETYHQDYAHLHPNQPYIAMHDLPKIEALKRLFPAAARAKPVLVTIASSGE
jgi:peptide-methionine (S)-S-oxide reductase